MLIETVSIRLSRFAMAILAVALCALFAGCHPQAYRRGSLLMGQPESLSSAPVIRELGPEEPKRNCSQEGPGCAVEYEEDTQKIVQQAFSLAYVEFDDAGEFWSIGNERKDKSGVYKKSQLEQAIELISRQKKRAQDEHRRLFVMGFVHGWQNNASPHDEIKHKNLRSFKNSLQFLATNCEDGMKNNDGKCPIVVGIFLAWRGRTITIPYLHAISYRDRRDAANHVGGPSMTEAVMLLALATKGTPPNYDMENRCQQPKPEEPETMGSVPSTDESLPDGFQAQFILVGHSFGGRALEHGVAQPMLALLLERKAQAEACMDRWNGKKEHANDQLATASILPPLDLIALINPANDALEAKSMIEAFKRSGLENLQYNHPLILSVKAEGDTATGKVMRIGQSIAAERPALRNYDTFQGATACQQGQLGLMNQMFYYRRSPGGIYNMASHQITTTKRKPPYNTKELCEAQNSWRNRDEQYFWGNFVPHDDDHKGQCFLVKTVGSLLAADRPPYSHHEVKQFYSCQPKLYQDKATPVPVWNDTPYYVMNAPKEFIRDHDDIFQLGLYNLLMLMISEDVKNNTVQVSRTPLTSNPSTAPVLPQQHGAEPDGSAPPP